MLKKITLIFVLFLSFFVWNNVFARISCSWEGANRVCVDKSIKFDDDTSWWTQPTWVTPTTDTPAVWWSSPSWWGIWWWGWPDDISSPAFEIETSDFSVWWTDLKVEWDSKATINKTLWTIIQKLMIALWVISLFVMTIWAWYMIMYHGQDEFLTKWKNIFIWWIISLLVALSSYYLVNLVWYILYK